MQPWCTCVPKRSEGLGAQLGYDIGRTTVQRILAEHGIEPAPQRKREYSWATFIKVHLGAIAGMDFFTVEVLTVLGLVRYHVLFVIDIGSRMVEVVGLARDPGGDWMKQMARNLLDTEGGFLRGKRYLILDRDPLYTKDFRAMLKAAGVKPLLLPGSEPKFERLRRAVRALGQKRMSGPDRAAGGGASAAGHQ